MFKIELFSYSSPQIKVSINAYFDGENLVIEGYDIGKNVLDSFGDSDYEYSMTILPEDVDKVYRLSRENKKQ